MLELFTSQGCASCPPADALFAEYAGRNDVVALTLAVDYWNYLGWEDTLATHENTERQRGYALARSDRQVYTPQIVIDGITHVVGSDKAAIDAALAAQEGAFTVPVALSLANDALTIAVGDAPAGIRSRGTVWLVLYSREQTVAIGKGENTGRTVTYHNVVKLMRRVAMWKGKALSVDLPLVELREAGADGCAALLQVETGNGLPGRMLGAALGPERHAAGN